MYKYIYVKQNTRSCIVEQRFALPKISLQGILKYCGSY